MSPAKRTQPLALVLAALVTAWNFSSGAEPGKPVTAEDRAHWAFVAPLRPPLPRVKKAGWARNPIDLFILAGLEENQLAPAPEADRPTLLRRVSFDLTGLPPTPAELDAFLADRDEGAFARVVDRLLASPAYGERWAQHWLDLARYADTDGFEFDQVRPDAWRYRDWVVAALNADLPYDRFLRLQLAGDEVAPDDPDAVVATGFSRCYPDMVDLNDQGLRRQNALNDITETTGLVFLGLTIGCARCHDHKTDPLPQADFYRLQAFFTPSRFRDDLPIASSAARAGFVTRRREWDDRTAACREELLRIEGPIRSVLTPGPPAGVDDESASAFAKPPAARTPREAQLVFDAWSRDRRLASSVWPALLGASGARARLAWLAKLDALKAVEPRLPQARGLDESGAESPPTFVLKRGEYGQPGPAVAPEFPTVLRPAGTSALTIAPLPHSTGRRRALADWLARGDNPLSSRVLVNRLWQAHFGRGIVATPSDFGVMGEPPSHPELLDWLATECVARGWSLKALHRLMVSSATYRQSSRPSRATLAADPDNEWFSRRRRGRLDGEEIRDALLAVSGRLSLTSGGPAVFPELPAELTKLSSKGAAWPLSPTREERSRRSLYVFVRRNLRYPFFEAFDRPDTNASCPRRSVTTIAPQALTLLNSALAHEAASGLAERIARESGAGAGDDARVRLAFRLVYGREPTPPQAAAARDFLGRDNALSHLCLALINANEFIYID